MLEWTSQILDMNEDKKAEEKFTIKMPSLMNVSPKAIIGTGWMGWKSLGRGMLTAPSVLITSDYNYRVHQNKCLIAILT